MALKIESKFINIRQYKFIDIIKKKNKRLTKKQYH